MACKCAALLGLVNELMGGSLIAPAGQELRPSAAATQWADAGVNQEVNPQAWASLGVALTHQVPYARFCTLNCPCSVLMVYIHSALAIAPTAILTLHSLCADDELFYSEII